MLALVLWRQQLWQNTWDNSSRHPCINKLNNTDCTGAGGWLVEFEVMQTATGVQPVICIGPSWSHPAQVGPSGCTIPGGPCFWWPASGGRCTGWPQWRPGRCPLAWSLSCNGGPLLHDAPHRVIYCRCCGRRAVLAQGPPFFARSCYTPRPPSPEDTAHDIVSLSLS